MTHEKITSVIRYRQAEAQKKYGGRAVMTALFGSQNYNLDDEQSDIDTVTFIIPTIADVACTNPPISSETTAKLGKCVVKDIREGLRLLKKTNPNSIEWFASKYIAFSPVYVSSMYSLLEHDVIYHASYKYMLDACAGMSHQLLRRNMSMGKRYAHALRIKDMWMNFKYGDNNILEFRSSATRDEAMSAKRTMNDEADLYFEKRIHEISDYFEMEKLIQEAYCEPAEKEVYNIVDRFQKQLIEYAFALQIIGPNAEIAEPEADFSILPAVTWQELRRKYE